MGRRFFSGEDYFELMTEKAYKIMKQFSPNDFPAMTNEDKIKETIKFGGMHGRSLARTMVYKDNAELFKNWDEKLFLGAFGCGVYNLLPEEVAQIFYDVLQEPEFNGKFKEIV